MQPIKMLGLAALAALMAMAFVGAGSARAEPTSLCQGDALEGCKAVTHVHETSVGKGVLLSEPTVECTVLFLGDTVAGTSEPLHINGTFTYSSCNNSCKVEEINGPALIEVLREGEHLAEVIGEGEVELTCFFGFIKCVYNGENLKGHGTDPLTSAQANGSVVINKQTTKKVKGTCPVTASLDITTTPLEAVYIGSGGGGGGGLLYCVKYEHNTNGLYPNSDCTGKAAAGNPYALVSGAPGGFVGEAMCAAGPSSGGLWTNLCTTDAGTLTGGNSEKGKITKVF